MGSVAVYIDQEQAEEIAAVVGRVMSIAVGSSKQAENENSLSGGASRGNLER